MVNALELAKSMRNKEQRDAEQRKRMLESELAHEIKEKAVFEEWIWVQLGSFGLPVEKLWFAGYSYWTLSRDNDVLCCCVLKGKHIGTYEGSWSGPHDQRGMFSNTEEVLARYIAIIMKDKI